MENFNFIDIIILVIFFSSIVVGLARGLVSEVISLATLIVAFFIAITFTTPLANAITNSATIQGLVNQASTASGMNTAQPASYVALGISFGLLFAATVIVGAIVKSLLNVAFQAGILGIGNRLLGGIFGFARGFLINLVLVFIVQLTPFSGEAWWQQSYFVQQFQPAVGWLGEVVSPALANIKTEVGQTLQSVTSQIQNIVK